MKQTKKELRSELENQLKHALGSNTITKYDLDRIANRISNIKSRSCYFCSLEDERLLEKHHVVPKRHGGKDTEENTVILCKSCHRKLEEVYSNRFYKKLGVKDRKSEKTENKVLRI